MASPPRVLGLDCGGVLSALDSKYEGGLIWKSAEEGAWPFLVVALQRHNCSVAVLSRVNHPSPTHWVRRFVESFVGSDDDKVSVHLVKNRKEKGPLAQRLKVEYMVDDNQDVLYAVANSCFTLWVGLPERSSRVCLYGGKTYRLTSLTHDEWVRDRCFETSSLKSLAEHLGMNVAGWEKIAELGPPGIAPDLSLATKILLESESPPRAPLKLVSRAEAQAAAAMEVSESSSSISVAAPATDSEMAASAIDETTAQPSFGPSERQKTSEQEAAKQQPVLQKEKKEKEEKKKEKEEKKKEKKKEKEEKSDSSSSASDAAASAAETAKQKTAAPAAKPKTGAAASAANTQQPRVLPPPPPPARRATLTAAKSQPAIKVSLGRWPSKERRAQGSAGVVVVAVAVQVTDDAGGVLSRR